MCFADIVEANFVAALTYEVSTGLTADIDVGFTDVP
jgi:hypothetical protein